MERSPPPDYSRASGSGADQRCLQAVEVTFLVPRPKNRLTVKLVLDGAESMRKFGGAEEAKGERVRWEPRLYAGRAASLTVTISEALVFKRARVYARVIVPRIDNAPEGESQWEDAGKKVSVKLTFGAPPQRAADAAADLARANVAIDDYDVLLDKLGRTRDFVATVVKLGNVLGAAHPVAKIAFDGLKVLYEECLTQEETRSAAKELVDDLTEFLPITDDVPRLRDQERARAALTGMLILTAEASEYVLQCAHGSVLGGMFSNESRAKVETFRNRLRRLKEVYEWCVKVELLHTAIETEQEMLLQQLQPTSQAFYSPDEENICLKGTRTELLTDTVDWSTCPEPAPELKGDSRNGSPRPSQRLKRVFWLYGPAGSGKSSVANTVAKLIDEQGLLFPCFFCKRDSRALSSPERVLPTLAYYFAQWHKPYRTALIAALRGPDRAKLDKGSLEWQLSLLFEGPLARMGPEAAPPRPLLCVIDALDECGSTPASRTALATHISKLAALASWLRILITSRPSPEIVRVFAERGSGARTMDINADGGVVQDIAIYTRAKVRELHVKLNEEEIAMLASKAGGLFVWASTVFRFVEQQLDRTGTLEGILKGAGEVAREPEKELDALYTSILTSVCGPSKANAAALRAVLGVVYATAANHPLPVEAIAHFLQRGEKPSPVAEVKEDVVKRVVEALQPVLYTDRSLFNSIRACHPSFLDYISEKERAGQFWTDPVLLHQHFYARCMENLDESLRFNMCDLQSSSVLNKDVPGLTEKVQRRLSKPLQYSVVFWMIHLRNSGLDANDENVVASVSKLICSPKTLFWLESLSLMKELGASTKILYHCSTFFKGRSNSIYEAAQDLHRMVSAYYEPMANSTPHIYISALSWVPSECDTAKQLYRYFRNQPLITAGKMRDWNATLWTQSLEGVVYCVDYAPDGRHVCSGIDGNAVQIWDAETGQAVGGALAGHTDEIRAIAWAPDARRIASASGDKTVRIWDLETGGPANVPPLVGHDDWVRGVAWAPDGRRIATGSDDKTVRVWNSSSGETIGKPLEGHEDWVRAVSWAPDGKRLASGSDDGTIRIWEWPASAKQGTLIKGPLIGHAKLVYGIAWSPDGKLLASASKDRTIRVWSSHSGRAAAEPLKGHSADVNTVAFSPNGKLLASGADDKIVRFWDTVTWKPARTPLTGHSSWVRGLAWSPDGRRLVTGSDDNTVRVWDAEAEAVEEEATVCHEDWIRSVSFSADGKYIISGSDDKTVRMWDASTGKPVGSAFTGHFDLVYSVALSPDGRFIASASKDHFVEIWSTQVGLAMRAPLWGHTDWVRTVAFSPDGTRIVSGSDDGTLRIWDVSSGNLLFELRGHESWVRTVVYTQDGKFIISGSRDMTIRLWSADNGEAVGEPLRGHTGEIYKIACSPGSKYIVSGAADDTIRVWDIETWTLAKGPFTGHTDWVHSVAFSPDGRQIASGSRDRTIRIWDRETGQTIGKPLTGHQGEIFSVAYAPDGKRIVSGGADNSILVWNLDVLEPTSFHWNSELANDGWVRDPDGRLLLWVPLKYTDTFRRLFDIGIGEQTTRQPTRPDLPRLFGYSGDSWTKIYSGEDS